MAQSAVSGDTVLSLIPAEIPFNGSAYIILEQAGEAAGALSFLSRCAMEMKALGARRVMLCSRQDIPELSGAYFRAGNLTFSFDSEMLAMRLCPIPGAPEEDPGIALGLLDGAAALQYQKLYNDSFAGVPNAGACTFDDLTGILHDPARSGGLIRLSGEAAGVWEVRSGDGLPEIATFALKESFRGKGIGKRALGALLSGMLERGFRGAKLRVSSVNIPAVRLYTGAGFGTLGVLSRWYRCEFSLT